MSFGTLDLGNEEDVPAPRQYTLNRSLPSRGASPHLSRPSPGASVSPNREHALDAIRVDFLQDLENSNLNLNDWEAEFVESNVTRKNFSTGQRKVIDKLRKKFENKL